MNPDHHPIPHILFNIVSYMIYYMILHIKYYMGEIYQMIYYTICQLYKSNNRSGNNNFNYNHHINTIDHQMIIRLRSWLQIIRYPLYDDITPHRHIPYYIICYITSYVDYIKLIIDQAITIFNYNHHINNLDAFACAQATIPHHAQSYRNPMMMTVMCNSCKRSTGKLP